MRREDGKTSLEIILILVITIIIVGVIVAMVYEKPKKHIKCMEFYDYVVTGKKINI